MKVRFKFNDVKTQRDKFVVMMDMLHYGMYDDDLEIGPFSLSAFEQGIWVRGLGPDVNEFVEDFERKLGARIKYIKRVEK